METNEQPSDSASPGPQRGPSSIWKIQAEWKATMKEMNLPEGWTAIRGNTEKEDEEIVQKWMEAIAGRDLDKAKYVPLQDFINELNKRIETELT